MLTGRPKDPRHWAVGQRSPAVAAEPAPAASNPYVGAVLADGESEDKLHIRRTLAQLAERNSHTLQKFFEDAMSANRTISVCCPNCRHRHAVEVPDWGRRAATSALGLPVGDAFEQVGKAAEAGEEGLHAQVAEAKRGGGRAAVGLGGQHDAFERRRVGRACAGLELGLE
jgi:hypothetical protein